MRRVSRRCTIEKHNSFEVAILSILQAVLGEQDLQLRALVVDLIGGLLRRKDTKNFSTKILLDAPMTNLMLRLPFIKAKCQVTIHTSQCTNAIPRAMLTFRETDVGKYQALFDLLVQLGQTDNHNEHQLVYKVWIGFVERLASDESRDAAEAALSTTVIYWTGCVLDNTARDRKVAAMQVVRAVCANSSAAQLMCNTLTSLDYELDSKGAAVIRPVDPQTTEFKVNLAAYLAGAVSIAAQEERDLGTQILEQIFFWFPSEARAFKQLFEVIGYVAHQKNLVRDAAMPVRFWIAATKAYCARLEASSNVVALSGQAKMHASVIPVVHAQVLQLLPAWSAQGSSDAEQVEGETQLSLHNFAPTCTLCICMSNLWLLHTRTCTNTNVQPTMDGSLKIRGRCCMTTYGKLPSQRWLAITLQQQTGYAKKYRKARPSCPNRSLLLAFGILTSLWV